MRSFQCGGLSGALWVLTACATPVHEQAWIEVETPNFQVVSAMSAAETLELARELEGFRLFVYRITNAPERPAPVATRIFAFASETQFDPFRSRRGDKGYFLPGMRSNDVAIVKNRVIDPGRAIRHEYVHFLLRSATSNLYPPWYDEGLAEFLSTARIRGEQIVLGAVPKDRIDVFRYGRWISLSRITGARALENLRPDELDMFYAESWALVHYLYLGRGGLQNIAPELGRYRVLAESGTEDGEAFAAAFGESPERVGITIQKYLAGRIPAAGYPLAGLGHEVPEPRVRALDPDAVLTHLGQLLLLRDPRKAQELFETAVAANPGNARAHAGLGDALKLQGEWEAAASHFERALALDPRGAPTQLDYGEFLHESAMREEKGQAERAELFREARRHYVKAQDLDPTLPEIYAVYGYSFVQEGANPAAGIDALEHAAALLGSNAQVLQLLAHGYLAVGRESEARAIVERQVAWSHQGERGARVDEILEALTKVKRPPVSRPQETPRHHRPPPHPRNAGAGRPEPRSS